MQAFIGVPYGRKFYIDPEITIKFTHTGHMLGGGVVNLTIKENGSSVRIAYTGDIGRPHPHVIKEPEPFPQCDVLITEATYGDRLHADPETAGDDLLKVIRHTCVEKGGKLVIPSFSVGRTQEIVYSLNKFSQTGRLPPVDVFVDSPLSVNATQVFRLHPECFSSEVLKVMETDPDPFGFNSLRYIEKVQDSMKLNTRKEPCIIISASGMAEAGRIKHHLANSISDPKNTVLFVGYCAPVTLGARILSGKKDISIHGNPYTVRADIRRIDSYSGHGDYKEMAQFLSCQDPKQIAQTALVHGDQDAAEAYSKYLGERGFNNVTIPAFGENISW